MNNFIVKTGDLKKGHKILGSILLASALTFASFGASADWGMHQGYGPGHHGYGYHGYGEGYYCGDGPAFGRIDKMGEMLDLSGDQMAKIKSIMKTAHDKAKAHRADRFEMQKAMMGLNPADSDYMRKVDDLADKKATQMKARMHEMASIRQQIFAVLTDKQKQKMERLQERREMKIEDKMEYRNKK